MSRDSSVGTGTRLRGGDEGGTGVRFQAMTRNSLLHNVLTDADAQHVFCPMGTREGRGGGSFLAGKSATAD